MASKQVQLHGAVETTYGTLVTLGPTHTIETDQLKMQTVSGKFTVSTDSYSYGNVKEYTTGMHVKLTFRTYLVGSGTLGTAPKFIPLFFGSRCKVVSTVSTVEVTPDSAGTASLSLEFNINGRRHRMVGARGTGKMDFTSQQAAYVDWDFTGLYVAAVDAVPLAQDFTGWIQPTPLSFQNTPIVEFNAVTTGWVFKKLTCDIGNEVKYRNNPGEERVYISGRESTGDVELLAPTLATFNAFEASRLNTTTSLKLGHGTVAAQRVIFEAGFAKIQDPQYGDDDGEETNALKLRFENGGVADGNWKLRFAAT
jgi:hypothetical protein